MLTPQLTPELTPDLIHFIKWPNVDVSYRLAIEMTISVSCCSISTSEWL